MKETVNIGIIGSQFISTIHADSLRGCGHAKIIAVASPTKAHAQAFAEKFGIPRYFCDYKEMLADKANEGLLSVDERAEYQGYVDAAVEALPLPPKAAGKVGIPWLLHFGSHLSF